MFDFSSDFVGLQEPRLTQAGQRCMQQLARESGWDCFLGFPPLFSHGRDMGGTTGGGGWDSSAEGAGYAARWTRQMIQCSRNSGTREDGSM